MTQRVKRIIAAGAAAALVGAGSFVAIAAAGGGDGEALAGAERDRAVAAALAHTGGGTVLEAEAGDDGAAYEVEVRRPDGTVVEVHLDRSMAVTGTERDDDGGEGPGDDDGE